MLLSLIICLDEDSPGPKTYDKVLLQFSSLFGQHLQIDGDPLAYPHLSEFLDICARHSITEIGIRASKLTSSNIDMLKREHIRSLMLRVQSLNRETNDQIMQQEGAHSRFLCDLKLAREVGIPIEISVVLFKENLNQLDDIVNWSAQNGIGLVVLERSIIGRVRKFRGTTLLPGEYKELMQWALRHNNSGKTPGVALSHCPNKILLHSDAAYSSQLGGCSAGIISCAIDSSGEILPCLPLFGLKLGNVRESELRDIWEHSDVFKLLRERSKLTGRCGECRFLVSCGGCRAEAVIAGLGIMGEDISCWNKNEINQHIL